MLWVWCIYICNGIAWMFVVCIYVHVEEAIYSTYIFLLGHHNKEGPYLGTFHLTHTHLTMFNSVLLLHCFTKPDTYKTIICITINRRICRNNMREWYAESLWYMYEPKRPVTHWFLGTFHTPDGHRAAWCRWWSIRLHALHTRSSATTEHHPSTTSP